MVEAALFDGMGVFVLSGTESLLEG